MPSQFPENPLEAYGAATAALARADERVAMCANPRALLARLRRSEQQALALLEGEDILHDQLALEYGASPRAWRRWCRVPKSTSFGKIAEPAPCHN